jgi:hypothetical protein
MPETSTSRDQRQYASSADFYRIFNEEMVGLYLWAFLLTADREKAEQCFVSGVEDSVRGNPVFKEWARSWARRVIAQNAIRVINPRLTENNRPSMPGSRVNMPSAERPEIAAVLALEPFERFVYVMSVLERYSDHDCSLLLGCTRRDVMAARIRTLQQVGSAMRFPLMHQLNVGTERTGSGRPELQLAPR